MNSDRFGISRWLMALILGAPVAAQADEGMWTLNNFPKDKVAEKYGFTPSDAWLDEVRLASVRLTAGCSASFVSDQGLVLTNHHCAHRCVAQLSSAAKDFVASGFYAPTAPEEVRCPDIEAGQLIQISDVSARVQKATKGLSADKFQAAFRAETSKIENECAKGDAKVRCDVVTLYHGSVYNLYKYRRFQDVRLVFAPEFSIAFFGGDPDNFNFPRYDLDMAMLRIYENGKPAQTPHYFRWSPKGPQEGTLSFVSGHPGHTDRQLTIAELEYQRDHVLPERLVWLAELRGMLTEFQRRSPEAMRIATDRVFYTENSYKAFDGKLAALRDKRFFATKQAEEEALRQSVRADAAATKAFDEIARAEDQLAQIRRPLALIADGGGFATQLFEFARVLVRGPVERAKPNEKRLDEYRDSALPQLTQRLFSTAPIHDELEIAMLTFSLTKMRELLGADDPVVKEVLGKESPEELAARLIKGSQLKDAAFRKKLWAAGPKAVEAANDPMIKLVRAIDPQARALRKKYEDEIVSVLRKNGELIGKARFAALGTKVYPDASFTLRLSYGQVKGWEENGRQIPALTTVAGAFERATGRAPFALPQSWLTNRAKLDPTTPFDFVTTNDIIGGNSGSPIIDKDRQLIGLIFDGNLPSLGGDFGYDGVTHRAIGVDSQMMIEALQKIYGADRIVRELRAQAATAM